MRNFIYRKLTESTISLNIQTRGIKKQIIELILESKRLKCQQTLIPCLISSNQYVLKHIKITSLFYDIGFFRCFFLLMRIIYKQIHLISCLNIHDKEKILVKMQILTGILQFHFVTHISLQDSLNIFRKAVFHSIGMFHSIGKPFQANILFFTGVLLQLLIH